MQTMFLDRLYRRPYRRTNQMTMFCIQIRVCPVFTLHVVYSQARDTLGGFYA